MRVAFLLLIRLRFPKSMSNNLRRKYGQSTLKRIQKLEKLDYGLRKAELNLQFL